MHYNYIIRIIPQATVEKNNLGPHRSAGQHALAPDRCGQPSLCLHYLCLEALPEDGNELMLFWAKVFPLFIL